MKNTTLFFLCLSLAACGSKNDRTSPPAAKKPQAQVKSLDGLATPELLVTKYERLMLICDLAVPVDTFDHGVGLGRTGAAAAAIDLLRNSSMPQTIDLSDTDEATGIVTTAQVQIEKLHVDSVVRHQTEDGSRFEMRNSPVAEGRYRWTRSRAQGRFADVSGAGEGDGVFATLESGQASGALKADAEAHTNDNLLSLKVGTHLGCRFDAKIRPAYQDQFKKVK